MTSNQELRKEGGDKNATSKAGMLLLCKVASSCAKKTIMAAIVELVENAAANNGGRIPTGYVPKLIQQFSKVAPGLTRDQINHYRKEHKRSAATISSTTSENLIAASTSILLSPMTASNLPQDAEDADPPTKKRQKGGRQKGTTIKSSQAELERYHKACAEAAQEYQNALNNFAVLHDCVNETMKPHTSRYVKRGTLHQIIEDAKKRHNVTHLDISKATIRTRIKRRSLAPSHHGLVSPMEQIEPMLVELCIQLGHARQPVSVKTLSHL
jgi:hypothetical protein